jgi:hypothetical protein
MRKALMILSCILAIYGVIGAQSGAITDCKKKTFCKLYTLDSGNCAIEYEYERCSGGLRASITPATDVKKILVRATVELRQLQYTRRAG